MSLAADLHKLRTFSPTRRGLLIQAYLCVTWMSIAISLYPLRYIIKWLRFKEGACNFSDISPDQERWLHEIGAAVISVAGRLHVRSNNSDIWGACLAQAIAAMVLLRNKKIPCNLILGMAKDKTAHAWLQCGDIIVTGRSGVERYTPVATFTW